MPREAIAQISHPVKPCQKEGCVMTSPNQTSVSQLSHLIGTAQCPILLDICIDEDFAADPRLIPTAYRHPFIHIDKLVPRLIGKKVVVICQKGLKLSQGAAAILRIRGIEAEYLEGGNFAWRDAGAPLIPAKFIPARNGRGETQWVTSIRPRIGRIACSWLIRRFIDPDASFLFVSPTQVKNVAENFNATPFDIEKVFWSRRGKNSAFDTMLEEFSLETEPLLQIANIIRCADTGYQDLSPEAAGLNAISLGMSRIYSDDLEQLDAGMLLFDALYRWARDDTDKTYNRPAISKT